MVGPTVRTPTSYHHSPSVNLASAVSIIIGFLEHRALVLWSPHFPFSLSDFLWHYCFCFFLFPQMKRNDSRFFKIVFFFKHVLRVGDELMQVTYFFFSYIKKITFQYNEVIGNVVGSSYITYK